MKNLSSRRCSDSGFSLVELAIYIVVLGIFSAIVATLVLSLFQTEKTVSGVTNSTSDSQNMVSLLQSDIRNARQIDTSTDGLQLTASVVGRDPDNATWQCVQWSVDEADAVISRKMKAEDSGTTWPEVSAISMLTHIEQLDESRPFFSGTADFGVVDTVTYTMRVSTANSGFIDVSGSVDTIGQSGEGVSNCL